MSQLPIFGIGLYLIWSLSSLGLLFDNSIWGWINELLRSMVCLLVYHTFGGWKGFIVPAILINVLYGVSVAISIVAYLILINNKEIQEDKGVKDSARNKQQKKVK